MEITITINGKPVQATVDDAVIREAIGEKKPEKKTNYEMEKDYYFVDACGEIIADKNTFHPFDVARYKCGNYYLSKEVAENNARADKLMRQLRRFAAEHGGCGKPEFATHIGNTRNDWSITCVGNSIQSKKSFPNAGSIHFKNEETANDAIEAFRDELIWYFTEYDPMPEGWWDS